MNLEQEQAVLIAMGRAQVADQELVKKSASGKENEIRKCTRCNVCCFRMTGDTQMHCTVNPDYKK